MRQSRRIASSAGSFNSSSYSFTGTATYTDEGNGAWNIQFKSSGTLTVYTTAIVDVHCVGGGGGGTVEGWGAYEGGGGGAGGYTTTSNSKTMTPGTYTITIGAGGSPGYWDDTNYSGDDRLRPGGTGGTSSALSVSANGGGGGLHSPHSNTQSGGNGGSGGGAGSGHPGNVPTNGASNGGNAADSTVGRCYKGGIGQGRTTRDFGLAGGTLRSGGGGGGGWGYAGSGGDGGGGRGSNGKRHDNGDMKLPALAGTANYGGGGGGGGTVNPWYGAGGGSGIVLIRSHR